MLNQNESDLKVVSLFKKCKTMKLILSAVAFVFALQVNAQNEKKETSTVSKPTLEFKQIEIVRENIKYNADSLFRFEFKNVSKEPVIIQNVQTSCGCTTAKKPEQPIQPKEKSEISVVFDTKRVGPFTKTITVTSSAGDPIVLTIRGSVLPQEQPAIPAEQNQN